MRPEVTQVIQVQVMSGIDPDVQFVRGNGGTGVWGYGRSWVVLKIMGKGAGIEFDAISANCVRSHHHFLDRVYEYRNPNTAFVQSADYLPEQASMNHRIPARIRSQLLGGVGYQRALMGRMGQNQIEEFSSWIALDVELGSHCFAQDWYVIIPYMTLIGTWVYRNALCAKGFAIERHLEQVGKIAATGIAHQRYFIEIYTEPGHDFTGKNLKIVYKQGNFGYKIQKVRRQLANKGTDSVLYLENSCFGWHEIFIY